METLIINIINKNEIDTIKRHFLRFLDDFDTIGVSDYEYSSDNLRVFVDFGFCLNEIDIKKIEVLDADYDEIDTHEALDLKDELRDIVAEYNKESYMTDAKKKEEQEYIDMIIFDRN